MELPGLPVITSKIKPLFDRAFEGITDAKFTPISYLDAQVVSGLNHRVLSTKDSANTLETYAIVTLYENLEGGIEISKIVNSEITTDFFQRRIVDSGRIRWRLSTIFVGSSISAENRK